MKTKNASLFVALALMSSAIGLSLRADEKKAPQPLKALLVIGGCCHDYDKQKDVLKSGLEERANILVDIIYTDDKGTQFKFPHYQKADWAAGYDVVIHNECTADVKDVPFVENIVNAHKEGVPAVNLHCAMHSYRVGEIHKPVTPGSADALWFDLLGLQSTGHGPQLPIDITFTDAEHPVTKGLESWTTVNEELYNNVQVYDSVDVLAKGKQGNSETVVAWTHKYGPKKTRTFSTTIGHNTETIADDRFLSLITRGLLWSCGKLDDAGQPLAGYGPVSASQ